MTRDREADRQRFDDPEFNKWLDEVISDAGHTVWDQIPDVCCAWHGWENRQYYVARDGECLVDDIVEMHAALESLHSRQESKP